MKISNPFKSCNFDVNSNSSEYTKQTGEMLLFTLISTLADGISTISFSKFMH